MARGGSDSDWRKYILINPIDVIFRDSKENLGNDGKPFTNIDIRNTSGDNIIFKIKTTDPQNYIVRPNQGVIQSEGSMNIRI
jgi:hypothetical protein